jgi:hypothetical protein
MADAPCGKWFLLLPYYTHFLHPSFGRKKTDRCGDVGTSTGAKWYPYAEILYYYAPRETHNQPSVNQWILSKRFKLTTWPRIYANIWIEET